MNYARVEQLVPSKHESKVEAHGRIEGGWLVGWDGSVQALGPVTRERIIILPEGGNGEQ